MYVLREYLYCFPKKNEKLCKNTLMYLMYFYTDISDIDSYDWTETVIDHLDNIMNEYPYRFIYPIEEVADYFFNQSEQQQCVLIDQLKNGEYL